MPAIIIHNLWFGHRPGMLNNRSTNGVNPLLFLLIRIGNKIHSLSTHGKLKGEWSIENIFSTFDGETCRDRDDASWFGGSRNDAFFEPEELPWLQNKPSPAPCLDILTLLHEPSGAFGIDPESYLMLYYCFCSSCSCSCSGYGFLAKETWENPWLAPWLWQTDKQKKKKTEKGQGGKVLWGSKSNHG